MYSLARLSDERSSIVCASGIFAAMLAGLPPSAEADIYQYVDTKGTITLTNVPNDARFHKILTEIPRPRTVISEGELAPVIARHSRTHRLHPALIRAVIKAESDFDPMAVSRAGAIGLMQLMPQTAVPSGRTTICIIRIKISEGGPNICASCWIALTEIFRWPSRPTMQAKPPSSGIRRCHHSKKLGNM